MFSKIIIFLNVFKPYSMIEQYSRREYLPLKYKLQGIVILNWNYYMF